VAKVTGLMPLGVFALEPFELAVVAVDAEQLAD
jgi:hypothetical protein